MSHWAVYHSGVGRTVLLPETLEKNAFHCLSQLPEASPFPWMVVPSSNIKANNTHLPDHYFIIK